MKTVTCWGDPAIRSMKAGVLGLLLLPAMAATASAQSSSAGPQIQYRGNTPEVLGITRLFSDPNCLPDTLEGRVVKRNFAPDQMMLQNFIIEEHNGSRSLINVDEDEIRKAIPSMQGGIVGGLQALLKEGNRVAVKARYCGASGRVAVVESVRLLPRR